MRGKVHSVTLYRDHVGITPAYAGKRVGFELRIFLGKDHPRLCGEKLNGDIEANRQQGSPPPMRGKAVGIVKSKSCARITPAYAGKRR